MSNTAERYNGLRDAGIVLVVLALVFYFDPVEKVFTAMGGRKDGGVSFILTVGIIAALTSAVISLRHYWKWVFIATLGAAAVTILKDGIEDYEYYASLSPGDSLYGIFLFDSLGNGLVCLILALPLARGVFFIRKKLRKGRKGDEG